MYVIGNPQPSYSLNIPMEPIKVEPRDKTPSPYGGVMYDTSSVSPSHFGVTLPTGEALFTTSQQPNISLPPMDINGWMSSPAQMPSTSLIGYPDCRVVTCVNDLSGDVNLENANSIMFDLDKHEMELKVLNSGDLNIFDTNNLSETFAQNVSLTDVSGGRQDQNMTDSLTRLANNTLDTICQGGNIFKGPH